MPNPQPLPNQILHPVDALALRDIAGMDRVAVGFAEPADGTAQIRHLYAYLAVNGAALKWAVDGVDLPLSDARSLSAHPTQPSHLLALVGGTNPQSALDVDPWSKTRTPATNYYNTKTYLTISTTLFHNTKHII